MSEFPAIHAAPGASMTFFPAIIQLLPASIDAVRQKNALNIPLDLDPITVANTVTGPVGNVQHYAKINIPPLSPLDKKFALVAAALVLTGKPYSAKLAPSNDQLEELRKTHGQALEQWWRDYFGHAFDRLTQSEASPTEPRQVCMATGYV